MVIVLNMVYVMKKIHLACIISIQEVFPLYSTFFSGTIVKKKEEDLVIPMIAVNKWKERESKVKNGDYKDKDKTEKKELSIKEQAALELIEESRKQMEVGS